MALKTHRMTTMRELRWLIALWCLEAAFRLTEGEQSDRTASGFSKLFAHFDNAERFNTVPIRKART